MSKPTTKRETTTPRDECAGNPMFDPEQHPNPEVRQIYAKQPPEGKAFIRFALKFIETHGAARFNEIIEYANGTAATTGTLPPSTRIH